MRARNDKRRANLQKQPHMSDEGAKVSRELREKLKKAKAAKGLLKDLEEQVRFFVHKWENASRREEQEPEMDSEDEEIVFVGRNGKMDDIPSSPKPNRYQVDEDLDENALVFDSLATDQGASFGFVFFLIRFRIIDLLCTRRWLVHSIAAYYGLRTWSITVGDPARREAYVGIPPSLDKGYPVSPVLQRQPLWGII